MPIGIPGSGLMVGKLGTMFAGPDNISIRASAIRNLSSDKRLTPFFGLPDKPAPAPTCTVCAFIRLCQQTSLFDTKTLTGNGANRLKPPRRWLFEDELLVHF